MKKVFTLWSLFGILQQGMAKVLVSAEANGRCWNWRKGILGNANATSSIRLIGKGRRHRLNQSSHPQRSRHLAFASFKVTLTSSCLQAFRPRQVSIRWYFFGVFAIADIDIVNNLDK
jgi:hypothetical protein